MKVFLTGGSGFVGSAVLSQLIGTGHEVLTLARSNASAEALRAAGAEVLAGDLDNLDALQKGAEQSEGVVHIAFTNDFSQIMASSAQDAKAIETMGSAFEGSDRPLVITSVGIIGKPSPSQPAVETFLDRSNPNPMRMTEFAGADVADRGVNISVVRLPQVHNTMRQGIPGMMRQLAEGKKVSAYIGDGANRWAAAYLDDVALLYQLALERKRPGSVYHAVGEEGVALKEIAEAIGTKLRVPVISISMEEAQAHFGPIAVLVGADMSVSNTITKEVLGWSPVGPGLLSDLQQAQ